MLIVRWRKRDGVGVVAPTLSFAVTKNEKKRKKKCAKRELAVKTEMKKQLLLRVSHLLLLPLLLLK